jgi:FtsK/SpoIIIE family
MRGERIRGLGRSIRPGKPYNNPDIPDIPAFNPVTPDIPVFDDAPAETTEPVRLEPGQWSRVLFRGDDDRRRELAGEVLARLAGRHAPGELRVTVRASPVRRDAWAWTRWLPHTAEAATSVVVLDGAEDETPATLVLDVDGTRERPGRTVLRLDTDAHGEVNAVWTDDAQHRTPTTAAEIAGLLTRGGTDAVVAGRPLKDLLDAAGPGAHWPPPLELPPPIDHLLPPLIPTRDRGLTTAPAAFLHVPAGVVDQPFERVRRILRVDLSGHLAIVGGPGSGRSTLAATLITALALTHTPREVQVYVVSPAEVLQALAGLPHVGAVVTEAAPVTAMLERRERWFRDHGIENIAELRRRRANGEFPDAPYGDVFVVIDDPHTAPDDITESPGVHVIRTADRADGIAPVLTLDARPGHGMTEGLHYLAALPRIDGVEDPDGLVDAVRALAAEVAARWTGPGAPPIRPLPELVTAASLPKPEAGLRAVLGVAGGDLMPVTHDFAVNPHLIIAGDPGSGRTNLLRLVIDAIVACHTPGEARILLADRDGGLLPAVPEDFMLGHAYSAGMLTQLVEGAARAIGERVPGSRIAPARLRSGDWWHGPRLFMLVDGYEEIAPGAFTPMLAHLGLGYEMGAHLVVAHAMAAADDALLSGMREARGATLTLSGADRPGRARYGDADIQAALADRA